MSETRLVRRGTGGQAKSSGDISEFDGNMFVIVKM
jgi:hypothetical protein